MWIAVLASSLLLEASAEMACASSPEAAVLQRLGMAQASASNHGYRVRDVVVDPLLQRTFIRVESCSTPQAVPILLPFAEIQAAAGAKPALPLPAPPATTVVKAGTNVRIAMRDNKVDLLLEGKTLGAAEVGSQVEVEVASLHLDGPGNHLRGRLVSQERVEVER